MIFQSKINIQIESRNHSRFWSIYRKALESTHYSKVRLTTVTYQLQACDGCRQTDVEVLCQCHNTNPPQTILQLSCFRVKMTLVAAFTNWISSEDGNCSRLTRSVHSVHVCVCVIVLSGQRSRSLHVQSSEDLTEAKKKEQKASWHFLQHGHSTISNKHRKMLTHNFYCSIIRRQFMGNIATYIMVGLSQGLQNYFQFLK